VRTPVKYLPDYANLPDDSGIRLHKVGIRGVYIKREWNDDFVVTRQSAYVSLYGKKGINMSRLAEKLLDWEFEPIDLDDTLLEELSLTHEGSDSYWKCRWKDIIDLSGPRMIVDLVLEGRYIYSQNIKQWYLSMTVPYASVCPCSMEMVKTVGRGVPHMQRSKAMLTVRLSQRVDLPEIVSDAVTDIADVVQLLPWMVMKRKDELTWCQKAAECPMFVEDVARKLAQMVEEWQWIDDWVIVVEHEESIHEHNAVAVVWRGVELR